MHNLKNLVYFNHEQRRNHPIRRPLNRRTSRKSGLEQQRPSRGMLALISKLMTNLINKIRNLLKMNNMNNIITPKDIRTDMTISFDYRKENCVTEHYTAKVVEVHQDNIFAHKYVAGSHCLNSRGGGRRFNFANIVGNIVVVPNRGGE